jgi:hypothetical protein
VPWLVLFLYLLALAVWLGEVVFFSVVVAPQVFGALPTAEAGAVVGRIFPIYYVVGHVCGVVLSACAVALRRWSRPGGQLWLAAAAIAALALAASLYAGFAVQPRIGELRPALHQTPVAPAVREEFDALHRRAVQLNAGVLVATLVLTGLLAAQLGGGVRVPRRQARRTSDLQW